MTELAFALLQAGPKGFGEHAVGNILKPLGTPAELVYNISLLAFAITGGIFLIVGGLIVYTLIRFRRRDKGTDYQEPAQVYGSNQIEVAWTVIPILIVFVLTGVTARVVAGIQDAKPPKTAVRATIVGHQWWWEINYPEYDITTANELHIPLSRTQQDRPTYLSLESVDVIHSFWIPQLSGKTDVIPNRKNEMWLDAREPGTYLGNCAEYCGTQHANMLIRVIVEPDAEFDRWVAAQRQPARLVERPAFVVAGRRTFENLACVNCHAIKGTMAEGKFGPDLTHLMSRQTIGSGMIKNNIGTLSAWVFDPQEIKPGCQMPSMKLSRQESTQVAMYLATLK